MKRDMDLVRELLLRVEGFVIPPGAFMLASPWGAELAIDGYDAEQVGQHFAMLIDGGFIASKPADMSGVFQTTGLTWKGHEFLDTIRSPEIWRKTKDGLGKVGGWSIELGAQLAKAYAKQLAREKLGIDLG